MALRYVGGTSNVGTANYSVSLSGTLTGGIASSPAEGDIVIVVSAFGNTASVAPTITGNNSGAYTYFNAATHVNDTYDTEFVAGYKVMGGTPDTSLSITRTSNGAYGGATVVMVFRNFDTTTPFYASGVYTTKTNGAYPNITNVSVAAVGDIVLAMGAGTQPSTGGVFTVPAELTDYSISVKSDGTTSDIGVWMAGLVATATGNQAISSPTGGGSNTSCSGAAHSIAITFMNRASTGDLVGSGSAVSGSASRSSAALNHATTGDLSAGTATVVGSASSATARPSSGALAGGTATVTGSASRSAPAVDHSTSGALSASNAIVVGASARTRTHTTAGTLSSGSAFVTGASARFRAHAATGTLASGTASLAGAASSATERTGVGVLSGGTATLSGAASRSAAIIDHQTSGALFAGAASLTGAADSKTIRASTGALSGAGATTAGAATRFRAHPSSGALTAQGPALSGAAIRSNGPVSHGASGALAGTGSTIVGASSRVVVHSTSGVLSGDNAIIVGSAARVGPVVHDASGALVGDGASVAGVSTRSSPYPNPEDVRLGVVYGPIGEFTGTLVGGGGSRAYRLRR